MTTVGDYRILLKRPTRAQRCHKINLKIYIANNYLGNWVEKCDYSDWDSLKHSLTKALLHIATIGLKAPLQ